MRDNNEQSIVGKNGENSKKIMAYLGYTVFRIRGVRGIDLKKVEGSCELEPKGEITRVTL